MEDELGPPLLLGWVITMVRKDKKHEKPSVILVDCEDAEESLSMAKGIALGQLVDEFPKSKWECSKVEKYYTEGDALEEVIPEAKIV